MTKIIQCINQHYYDKDKYKECPYCRKSSEGKVWIYNQPWEVEEVDPDDEPTRPLWQPAPQDINLGDGGQNGVRGLGKSDENVTVGIFKKHHQGNDLVTGWLVCTEGPSKGRDYRIRHGNNWIGRSQNSDIWMDADKAIANEKQCAVVYDGKSNHFYIVPGNGTITHVNGTILSDPRALETGDVIGIGNSEFEFIPFCREGHTWK